jgi:hypothetical protein
MERRKTPVLPMCKLAEYTVTASSTRRRALVKTQIKQALEDTEKRRWWHAEARAEIRKFFRVRSMTPRDLLHAANQLRDAAAALDARESKRATLLASARAIEAFLPIADSLRDENQIASPARRESARIHRGNVAIIVAPDLLFLERGTERVIGALKLHAVQEHKLENEALLNAAAILHTYLTECGERPDHAHCVVVDVFTPAFEAAPHRMQRRMQSVDAACEEIEGWWNAMYDRVKAEVDARRGAV